MKLKEKIKKEIDNLTEEQVQQVYNFIKRLKQPILLGKYKLKGQLDDVDIRSKANFVDNDHKSISKMEEMDEIEISPIVKELSGIISLPKNLDPKEERRKHFREK